jgi:ribonuclease P protein component
VVIARSSDGLGARLGITASSRIGNAIIRNRVKRIVREVFRHRRNRLDLADDLVVIAKPGAEKLSYAQAATELEPVLALRAGR